MSNILTDIVPLNVGIIGCGNIFPSYAKGCKQFRMLHLAACADLNEPAAKARAEEFQITAMTVDDLLADPSISIVINLTVPSVHARVSMQILAAGKHVYSEKPLAIDTDEGRAVVALAAEKNLRVGCAPDTFLGAGLQSCRKLIDDGWIGRPLGGTAFFMSRGPESWHPNPSFFYQKGAGPMLDMGPYYVTALVHLLGPVKSVSAVTNRGQSERIATCEAEFGRILPVEVPTHYSGNLIFENGAVINLGISFDIHRHKHSPIEIYGTEGSLAVPDPNTFGGPISIVRDGAKDWTEMPFSHGYPQNSRSIGAADMAHAIRSGRPHRCNATLALHALEVMNAFEQSSDERRWVDIETQCTQPAAFPLGMIDGVLDD